MSRDQQPDGSHGFGICVKGGKDSNKGTVTKELPTFILFLKSVFVLFKGQKRLQSLHNNAKNVQKAKKIFGDPMK